VKCSLIHHVEAGLVAVNQGEFRGRGEFAERGRDTGDIVAGRFGGKTFLEKAVLDGPEAAQAPVGGGHFLDHAELDAIQGAEMFDVLREEILEGLAGFALEDHAIGQEAVALARRSFALESAAVEMREGNRVRRWRFHEELAQEFQVSDLVIRHQIQNHNLAWLGA